MRNSTPYRDVQYSRMLIALGTFIAVGAAIAIGAVYGTIAQSAALVLGLTGVVAGVRVTRLAVTVDEAGVRLGSAHVEWPWISRCEVLEGAAMRAAISTEAHPSDYLRLRGTTAGVRLWLADPTDPHRAWVASVRDPAALRAWLAQHPEVAHAA